MDGMQVSPTQQHLSASRLGSRLHPAKELIKGLIKCLINLSKPGGACFTIPWDAGGGSEGTGTPQFGGSSWGGLQLHPMVSLRLSPRGGTLVPLQTPP